MININWKNTAENLILILASVIVGVIIGYTISIQVASRMLEEQKSIIEMAIKKETTSITNQVTTEIKKIKARKNDEPINMVIEPKPVNTIEQETNMEIDTLIGPTKPAKKQGFFKRLFGKD